MFTKHEYETYEEVESYTKIYPTFIRVFKYPQPIKQLVAGYELNSQKENKYLSQPQVRTDEEIEELHRQSLRRTKTRISDVLLSNSFELWMTFTFNCSGCKLNCKNNPCICPQSSCKRNDPEFQKKRMSKWISNQQKIHGRFKYLIVPEFHKDNKALHFHMLSSGYKGHLTKTNKRDSQKRPIYNIKSYQLGFSTAIYTDGSPKLSSYIKKYITKSMPQFHNKKRYWLSTGLQRPITVKNYPVMHNPFLNFEIEYSKNGFTIYRCDATITLQINPKDEPWNHQTYSKQELSSLSL